jgi:hypothetical protein
LLSAILEIINDRQESKGIKIRNNLNKGGQGSKNNEI